MHWREVCDNLYNATSLLRRMTNIANFISETLAPTTSNAELLSSEIDEIIHLLNETFGTIREIEYCSDQLFERFAYIKFLLKFLNSLIYRYTIYRENLLQRTCELINIVNTQFIEEIIREYDQIEDYFTND